tara:strand:+ start:288 stop:596 length:309 start_codon:yes stop_codon:yes gene_type:complete
MQKTPQIKSPSDVNRWRQDAMRADENIKFCTKCKKCYEKLKYQTGDNKRTVVWHVNYYRNFVSYGKERVICDNCAQRKIEVEKQPVKSALVGSRCAKEMQSC